MRVRGGRTEEGEEEEEEVWWGRKILNSNYCLKGYYGGLVCGWN